MVTPFPASTDLLPIQRPAVMLMLPRAAASPVQIAAAGLRERFGMTAREAELAGLLLEGLNPKQMARRLDVSVNTIRTHIARMLAKVGVNRQADMIRRLLQP